MRTRRLLAASGLALPLGLVACGSSSGGSSFNNNDISCISAGAPSSCTPCVQSSCTQQLMDFENACASYLQCACPNGDYDASAANSPTCEMDVTGSSACTSASQNMLSCIHASCASQCGVTGG